MCHKVGQREIEAQNGNVRLGLVAHVCNSSAVEDEAGGSRV